MVVVEKILRYKYLPFDEGSLNIIRNGTMKFSPPSKVNDPFDCAPDYEDGNIEDYLDSRPDLLRKACDMLNLTKNERINQKQKMIERLKLAVEEGAFGQKASDAVGICSLSRDPLNLLMWAHYAQHHKGFVVEFEIPVAATDINLEDLPHDYWFELLVPHEVEYEIDKPIISFFDTEDEKRRKQFLIKGIDWKYEQEERVIDYVRGHGIHTYDISIQNSVIAGMRMDPANYHILEQCIDELNLKNTMRVQLNKAEPIKGKYSLFVPNRPELKSASL
ncbi:DUF2971 domain-containing protein [Geobacter grbiciae]|uniref:DUF2971 domain-containing protein n=1 Tax=Geobacter grbiciae TaxID=155042 RepID=UPI001C00F80A|nr:DUF2971 domain-containing protein [Geobacter grbiciae]MBT1073783.1 DUF2971 domain-containing protein [Geobacter grbiciae]